MHKSHKQTTDVSDTPNIVAISLLVAFDETVSTAAGKIVPQQDGMMLHLEGKRRPRFFRTAKSALGVLRRATL